MKLTLGALAAVLALLLACSGPAPGSGGSPRDGGSVAISGVTVIRVESGASDTGMTVLLAGARIVEVGAADRVILPSGTAVLDGRGRFLIPGLWDMHSHVTHFGPAALDLYLASGVTTVRDMGANRFSLAVAWRDSIADGTLLGPRMLVASPVVERPEWLAFARRAYSSAGASTETLEERFGPTSAEEAIRWVDSVAAAGADHIKVRNWPAADVSLAIITRARELGLPVTGHANRPFPMAGVATYEHGVFPPLTGSAAQRDSMWRRFAAEGAAVVPTIAVAMERLQPLDSAIARIDPARNPLYRYVTPAKIADWRRAYEARRQEGPMDWEAMHAAELRNLREMRAAGVPVLAGSDGATPFVFPGFGLHRELELLVTVGGLSPLEALQAATIFPARVAGMSDSLGAVRAGMVADLVLLEADPLADIRNASRIAAVVARGRVLDAAMIRRLLDVPY